MTGTRGKSSVTRLLAAALREAGIATLTKTTGSKPIVILPDGSEEEIRRRGLPSILEEKRILRMGSQLRVQALVVEMMSILPESIFVESIQLVRPHIVVITNVRLDHLAQMGETKEEIARCFASSIPERGTVFVSQEESCSVFSKIAHKRNSKLVEVPKALSDSQKTDTLSSFVFEENARLSLAVAEFLGIKRKIALKGMRKTQSDFGSLRVWTAEQGSPSRTWYLASSFAANDPESTKQALDWLGRKRVLNGKRTVGLLNLRGDRGDRTLQWLKALKANTFPEFHKLVFLGEHSRVLKRKLQPFLEDVPLFAFRNNSPEEIMTQVFALESQGAVLVGMGNMGGWGKEIVKYWERIGQPHDA